MPTFVGKVKPLVAIQWFKEETLNDRIFPITKYPMINIPQALRNFPADDLGVFFIEGVLQKDIDAPIVIGPRYWVFIGSQGEPTAALSNDDMKRLYVQVEESSVELDDEQRVIAFDGLPNCSKCGDFLEFEEEDYTVEETEDNIFFLCSKCSTK